MNPTAALPLSNFPAASSDTWGLGWTMAYAWYMHLSRGGPDTMRTSSSGGRACECSVIRLSVQLLDRLSGPRVCCNRNETRPLTGMLVAPLETAHCWRIGPLLCVPHFMQLYDVIH